MRLIILVLNKSSGFKSLVSEIMKYSDIEGQFSSGTSIMESLHMEHLILDN